AALFNPRIKAWLDETRSGRPGNDASVEGRLSQAIDVLMQSDDHNMREMLEEIAAEEFSKGVESPFAKVWMPVLMQLNPGAGVAALEAGLKAIQPGERGVGVEWFSTLFGHDHRGTTVNLRRAEFSPKLLLRLVRLAYQHVRPADDVQHEGVHSL